MRISDKTPKRFRRSPLAALAACVMPLVAWAPVSQAQSVTTIPGFNARQNAILAPYARYLTPLTNGSLGESAYDAADVALQGLSTRTEALRGLPQNDSSEIYSHGQPTRFAFWGKGYFGRTSMSSDAGFDGYRTTLGGGEIGLDTHWQGGGGGIAFSRGISTIDERGYTDGDNAQIKSYQFSLYATQGFGAAYIEGTASIARQTFETNRGTPLATAAYGSYSGLQSIVGLAAGYHIGLGGSLVLTPIVALQESIQHQNAYTESGADNLDLAVEGQSRTRLRASVGVRLSANTGMRVLIAPEIHAFVRQNIGGGTNDVTARYADGGSAFVTAGYHVPRTSLDLGGSVTFGIYRHIALQLEADAEYQRDSAGIAGLLTARLQF